MSAPEAFSPRLPETLDHRSVASLWSEAERWTAPADASGVQECDGAGLALLFHLRQKNLLQSGTLPAPVADQLSAFAKFSPSAGDRTTPPPGWVSSVGQSVARVAADAAEQIAFLGECTAMLARCTLRPGLIRWGDLWLTVQRAGVDALGVAGMVSFLTGVIMAFQAAVPLRQFGVDIFVVNLVALAMLRELGPIMTAVVLAGRSGSAFAAEIGTMKVNEEVNALTTMGLDPMRMLVVPRVLAGLIVTPALTVYCGMLGILGGFLVMMAEGFPLAALWNQLLSAVALSDVFTGFIKSFVFGVLVAGIGCMRGLQTGRGASAVGESTTRAVVSGIFLIVVVDAIFAALFYVIGW